MNVQVAPGLLRREASPAVRQRSSSLAEGVVAGARELGMTALADEASQGP
jgi:hypothetical protein